MPAVTCRYGGGVVRKGGGSDGRVEHSRGPAGDLHAAGVPVAAARDVVVGVASLVETPANAFGYEVGADLRKQHAGLNLVDAAVVRKRRCNELEGDAVCGTDASWECGWVHAAVRYFGDFHGFGCAFEAAFGRGFVGALLDTAKCHDDDGRKNADDNDDDEEFDDCEAS